MTRREFINILKGGALASFMPLFRQKRTAELQHKLIGKIASAPNSDIFQIKKIPNQPLFSLLDAAANNHHAGIEKLFILMGEKGLKLYRSSKKTVFSGPSGLIAPEDVVLIKVNAQWKYRGCTNSDLIRGLIQRILDHPDVFTGEVVIFENGQGRGSLNCDTASSYDNSEQHANANDNSHSFVYLVNTVFNDPRVSYYLLDPIRSTFIGDQNHTTDGYRTLENVSYPCFTTAAGNRIELREGIWNGSGHSQNLKLINVPVLKHHDTGGSEITAALKHVYGILSMADGQSSFRHYSGLGETCGKMMVSVATPVLNIIDAIWVSYSSLKGYPASTTFRANQILASQDPVALDYWAAKDVLYPIDNNPRHLPEFAGVDVWLEDAKNTINNRGGLSDLSRGIVVDQVTKNEAEMRVYPYTFESVKILEAPVNFQGNRVLNRSLSQLEYINIMTWSANPNNVYVLEYRVYVIGDTGWSLLASVDAGTFKCIHRSVDKNKPYSYALTAVNEEGREGQMAYFTIQN
jgi:hypothetical protein